MEELFKINMETSLLQIKQHWIERNNFLRSVSRNIDKKLKVDSGAE